MFGEGIGDYIVGTLVLREYLFGLVCPSDVVVFEVNVARFGGDDWGGGEFDCRCVVFEHN